jgi:[CysO sulfur-carrier protein]-S-L-cysteine hydrolase
VVSSNAPDRPIGLTILRPIADAMLSHAHAELPNEACGILSGSLADGVASAFHPARNAEASPLRYSVHPEDLVRIVFEIEEAERDLVAIFHSHTRSAAVPSATDRRAAMYPDAFYVVASLANPDASPESAMRSWRIHGGQAFEVPLSVS